MASQKEDKKKHYKETKSRFKTDLKNNAGDTLASLFDLYNISWLGKGILKLIPLAVTLLLTFKGLPSNTGWRTFGIIASIVVFLLSGFDVLASTKKESDDIVSANVKLKRELSTKESLNQKNEQKWQKERDKLKKQLSEAEDSWERYQSINEIRKSIATAEAMIYEKQNRSFVKFIDHGGKIRSETRTCLIELRDPKLEIDGIFDELCSCFTGFCRLERSEISFSAAVRLNKTERWVWISKPKEKTASIDELQDGNSLFKTVAEKKGKDYDYIADKSNSDKPYIFDELDESYGHKGSIICWKIGLPCENREISMVISISTYGKQLVEITDSDGIPDDQKEKRISEAYEKTIRDIILKQFEGRLQEELLWYAILY